VPSGVASTATTPALPLPGHIYQQAHSVPPDTAAAATAPGAEEVVEGRVEEAEAAGRVEEAEAAGREGLKMIKRIRTGRMTTLAGRARAQAPRCSGIMWYWSGYSIRRLSVCDRERERERERVCVCVRV